VGVVIKVLLRAGEMPLLVDGSSRTLQD
jgi:hypothetical protein